MDGNMINTSLYEHPDSKTISCYVWTNDKDIRWYVVKVSEILGLYPELDMYQATEKIALERFKNE